MLSRTLTHKLGHRKEKAQIKTKCKDYSEKLDKDEENDASIEWHIDEAKSETLKSGIEDII